MVGLSAGPADRTPTLKAATDKNAKFMVDSLCQGVPPMIGDRLRRRKPPDAFAPKKFLVHSGTANRESRAAQARPVRVARPAGWPWKRHAAPRAERPRQGPRLPPGGCTPLHAACRRC